MHKPADQIRNVALVGDRGTGKTSRHEALLFEAGVTNRLGVVSDGSTGHMSYFARSAFSISFTAREYW